MVSFKSLIGALAFSTSVPVILAHPGEVHDAEKHEQEMAAMRSNSAHIARGLEECASHPNFLRLKARGAARRAKRADVLRKERRVPDHAKVRRDETYSDQYAAASHNLTSSGYSLSSSADDLFATYKNVSCSLTPETTEGPYYITGEYYRSDLVESQSGVPMHLEIQYVDVNTCDVASGIYIEAWHCNATGVYSGVSVSGNGVGTSDPANLNRTFLRGVQSTDAEGVAAFDTIFPGHYTGRAVHIHLLSHQNGTIFSNGTFSSGTVQSVGQIGFDQTLISAVEETAPYNTNTQSLTANTADSILVGASDAGNDPYVDYAYLGDDISDGILAWIHVGFDSSASISVSPGAYFYGTGGVEGSSSSGGPGGAGGSGGPGNSAGPAPSGAGGSGGGPSIPAAVPTTAGSAGASVSAVASSGSSPYASAVGSAFQSVMSGSASISASGPTPSSSRAVQSVLSGSAALGSTVSGGAYGTRSSRAQSVQSSRVPSGARAGTGSNSGAKPSASDSSKPAQGQSAQGQAGQGQSGQSNESHSTATTAAPVACGRA